MNVNRDGAGMQIPEYNRHVLHLTSARAAEQGDHDMKKRIAILGCGTTGIHLTYELLSERRYDVTIFTPQFE